MGKEMFQPVELGGMRLEAPIMNGAGPVKLPEHVLEVAQSEAAAIVLGSITVAERLGNPGNTYYAEPQGRYSLNSKGLPNPGLAYYMHHLPDMVAIAHHYGKPLIVSAAGFSPEEYARLASEIMNRGADGVELNLGCPNVWSTDGKQKEIFSFNEELTGETLRQVEQEVGSDGWTAVKLSPFSQPSKLEAIAAVLGQSELVKVVTTTNTFPNSSAFMEQGQPAIDVAGGLGGLSGEAMKPIGLGQVQQLRAVLPPAIAIVGVGGISQPKDVREYLQKGVDATQITTAYINFGPSIFSQLRGQEP